MIVTAGAGSVEVIVAIWRAVTTRGPIGWFRNLFYIVGNYRTDLHMIAHHVDTCREQLAIVEGYVKKATKIHVDIPASAKEFTKIIVIGTYRGRDHVQVFGIRPGSMDGLIEQLREMQRYAVVERIDAPLEVHATVKRSIIL